MYIIYINKRSPLRRKLSGQEPSELIAKVTTETVSLRQDSVKRQFYSPLRVCVCVFM